MFRLLSFLCMVLFWGDSRAYLLYKGSAEANIIINAHKKARQDIRDCKSYAKSGLMPKPSDMKYISYDNQMAKSAEEWGKEACRRGYKSCTHKSNWQNSMGISVGENLGCSKAKSYIANFMKQMIDDERAKYTYNGKDRGRCNNQFTNDCGHYTQIIWSTTNKVGCAINDCSNMLICHYSGPGNYKSKPPYTQTSGCSGGGGSNNGGSTNTGGGSSGAKCCECASNPSKSKCGGTCESAVKAKDSWCDNNAWDSQCKNYAKTLAKGCSSSGGSSNTGGGSNNGGSSSSGKCCGCKSAPSKTKCDYACRSYVHGKDSWCKSNTWDGQCKGYATKACSGKMDFEGDCGSNDRTPVCIGSTLWNDDYNATHSFGVDTTQCSNDKPVYNYTAYNEEHRFDVVYKLQYDKGVEDDGLFSRWTLTASDMKLFENDTAEEIVAAVCEKEDLKHCTKYEWEIMYSNNSKLIRDSLMYQELEVRDVDCSASMAMEEEGISVISIVLGIVIMVVVFAACFVSYYVYRKKMGNESKRDKEMVAMVEDDGCDETAANMEETIEVDVERDGMIDHETTEN